MRTPRIELDRARRRILAQLAGLVTGSALALMLVQFRAANGGRDRTDPDR